MNEKENKRKECPLTYIEETIGLCRQETCAWWIEEEKNKGFCAMNWIGYQAKQSFIKDHGVSRS